MGARVQHGALLNEIIHQRHKEAAMSDYLHWLTPLAVTLLFVATVTALASRCSRPRWQRFWPNLTAVLILIGNAVTLGCGIYLLKENLQPKCLFWYGLFQTIGYIIGVAIVLKLGLSGLSAGAARARYWPRARLAGAFVLMFIVHMLVFDMMQLKSMVSLANIRIGATCSIINLLPPQIPDALNARPVYEKAAHVLSGDKQLPDWFSDSLRADFDPASEKTTVFLAECQEVFTLVRQAAAMPGYSLDLENIDFFEWPIPKYAQYRNLALLLSLSARNRALSGGPAGALQDLAAMEAMAGHLRSYPTPISFVMAVAIEEIRISSLEYILARTSALAADAIRIPRTSRASVLNTFLKMLRVETQGQLQGFTVMAATSDIYATVNSSETVFKNATPVTKMWRIFFLPSELKAAKDIIAERLSRPAKTYSEVLANIKAVEEARQAGEMGILTSIASPSYTRYLENAMRHDARCGLSELALAATAYKAVKGEYPSLVEDLVPDFIDRIPPDPFDGQSLKLRHVDGGIELYSAEPAQDLASDGKEAVRFYLGIKPYEENRGRPAKEKKRKKEQTAVK